jgi:asparagine synthase (glutamine-hydrolysing)
MQASSTQPIRTFSIGFSEQAYDEACHAKEVAAHLGTEHTELYVTSAQALAVIPKLPRIYDEPFADSSQIPTYLVSEMTRRHVTVALSGDGGDEVFAGYNRYGQGLALAKTFRILPRPMRQMLAKGMTAVAPSAWDSFASMVPAKMRPRLFGDKVYKLASVLPVDSEGFYHHLITQWPEASSLAIGATLPDESPFAAGQERFPDDVAWMQYLDMLTYLPDDILTKVDRASMAVALEVRVPLLDHRVVELSWRLPKRLKLRGGVGKWILRQIAYKYVPKKLLERPKMGFSIPIDQWLRGPLKSWAEDLLSPMSIRRAGLLDPAPIVEKWAEHQAGVRNWQYFLWNVLMFEAWLADHSSAQAEAQAPSMSSVGAKWLRISNGP